MPDDSNDLGPKIALQAAKNLRRGRADRKSPRSLVGFFVAAWVVVVLIGLSVVVDIGLDVWRATRPVETQHLFVCLELSSSDGVSSRTGDDPCWAGAPDA